MMKPDEHMDAVDRARLREVALDYAIRLSERAGSVGNANTVLALAMRFDAWIFSGSATEEPQASAAAPEASSRSAWQLVNVTNLALDLPDIAGKRVDLGHLESSMDEVSGSMVEGEGARIKRTLPSDGAAA